MVSSLLDTRSRYVIKHAFALGFSAEQSLKILGSLKTLVSFVMLSLLYFMFILIIAFTYL